MAIDLARYYASWGSETAFRGDGSVISGDLVAKLTGASGVPYEALRLSGLDGKLRLPGGIALAFPAGSGTLARLEDITVGGGGESSAFEQIFTSVSSVVCVHNFGAKPAVQCLDDGGSVFVPLDITHDSVNQFTVTFSTARSGTVIANYGGGTGSGPSSLTTDDVPEGSLNLYYTDGRADARIAAAVGVSVQAYSAALDAVLGVNTGDQDLSGYALTSQLHDPVTLDANADTLLSLTTQALGLDTQTANYVFAGPTTGAAAVPTFRALVAGDIPALSYAAVSHAHAWSDITSGLPTTLGGYGITDAQASDAFLTSIAALGTAADKMIYTTGVDTAAETALTAAARTVLDDVTVDAMLTTLGGGTPEGTGVLVRKTSPTLVTPNIGAATGTSLALSGSGITIPTAGAINFSTPANTWKMGEFSTTSLIWQNNATSYHVMGTSFFGPAGGAVVDLGRVAAGYRSLFLDEAGAGTQTAQVIAPTLAADIVLTTPAATGTLARTDGDAIGATTAATGRFTSLTVKSGGAASDYSPTAVVLYADGTTTPGNAAGSGDTDLMSFVMSAGTLQTDSDVLEIEADAATTAARFRIVVGSTTVYDSGAGTTLSLSVRVRVARTSATTYNYTTVTFTTTGASMTTFNGAGSATWANAITIKGVGNGVLANVANQAGLFVTYKPVNT